MNWKIILVIALLLLLVIFTVQNYEVVELKFLFWSFRMSRAIVIFLALSAGFVLGWLISLIPRKV